MGAIIQQQPGVLLHRGGRIEVAVAEQVDEDAWNEKVRAYPQGCFYDTTMRHEAFRRCYPDARFYYLTARQDGREVGWLGLVETYWGHDTLSWSKGGRFLRPLFRVGMRSFDGFTAPLVSDTELEAEIIGAFLEALDELARERRVYLLTHFKYPPPGRCPAVDQDFFAPRGFNALRHGTYLIDLAKDIDELWNDLKPEARTAVRKAQKQGINVRLGESEEDIHRYYELFAENRRRDGTMNMPRPLYSYEAIADHVRFFGDLGMQQLFCAEWDGNLGSCTLVKHYNGIATFNSHARSDVFYEQKLHDGDLLCWEMIKWARGQGFRYFDMTGFDAEPVNERQQGIRRFKSKWGGLCAYYNYYSKIYGHKRDHLRTWLKRMRG